MNIPRAVKAAALLLPVVLVSACGSDDTPTEETAASAVSDPPGTTPASNAASTAASTPPATEAAEAFPVTIEHKFGETTIAAAPQRVVSIGFAEHDGLLAIGVEPIAVREWYGEQPYATWPWALDELGDLQPQVLPSAALNFEQIAALDPDLIIGINSGMTDTEYATLSAIAPTVAAPGDYIDYGTPWRVALEIAGRATGRSGEAAEVIAETEALFAGVRAAHPEFEGATASVAFEFEELPGAYASGDSRAQMLAELGFVTPPEFDELAGDAFWFSVSAEQLSTIDTDVIVWLGTDEAVLEAIRAMPLRPSLNAYAEGREVVADPVLASAFSHGSPLSAEYVLDALVPELTLALDGDPATVVPSAALIDPDHVAPEGFGAAEQAAADAWSLVFDSTVRYSDKAAHIEAAEELQATVESYTTAGEAMGGITLAPNDVTVEGDVATVVYDVMFGGTAAYTALDGQLTLLDGTWVVSREQFCEFMASARNSCPA